MHEQASHLTCACAVSKMRKLLFLLVGFYCFIVKSVPAWLQGGDIEH